MKNNASNHGEKNGPESLKLLRVPSTPPTTPTTPTTPRGLEDVFRDLPITDETSCGIWCIRNPTLQRFANKKAYVFLYGVLGCIFSASYAYFNGTITTIEKRFKIPSKTTGWECVVVFVFRESFCREKTYRIRENSEKKIVRVVNQGNRFSRFNYLSRPRSHLGGQRYLAIVRIGGPVLLRRKGSQASMDRIRDLHGEYWTSIYPPTSCPFHIRPLVRMRERRENLWQSAVGTRPKE